MFGFVRRNPKKLQGNICSTTEKFLHFFIRIFQNNIPCLLVSGRSSLRFSTRGLVGSSCEGNKFSWQIDHFLVFLLSLYVFFFNLHKSPKKINLGKFQKTSDLEKSQLMTLGTLKWPWNSKPNFCVQMKKAKIHYIYEKLINSFFIIFLILLS